MIRTIGKGLALLAAVLACSAASIASAGDEEGSRVLFDFNTPEAGSRWRSVNDGVMGGVSEGSFRIGDDGVMAFRGNLSLENNGGFASVRSLPAELGLSMDDVIVLRLRGDGRSYLLNLYTPTRRTAYSHRAEFPSTEGRWIDVRVPVRACEAQSFGRPVPQDGPVDASRVVSIGVTLSDKTPGPFLLEIASIRVAEGDGSTVVTVEPVEESADGG